MDEPTSPSAVTSATVGLTGLGIGLGPPALWGVALGLGLAAITLGIHALRGRRPGRGLAAIGLVGGVVAVAGSVSGALQISF